jgi:amidohydrolase
MSKLAQYLGLGLLPFGVAVPGAASASASASDPETLVRAVEPKVLSWFEDFHEHPELGLNETRTAGIVAAHLRALGIETRTGVGETGVVGLLRGGKPGPIVALRADMDALPVTEMTGLPYASKARTVYRGEEAGVMHACGHDSHTAILMGTAEVLSQLRSELAGTVMFVFQPAEEAALPGERSGAELMLEQGLFKDVTPDAIFGLHTSPRLHAGQFAVREGPAMASEDNVIITVKGVGTHASRPWDGIDPITVAAQIVSAVQTIVSRQINIAAAPAVISFGVIHGGVHANIIPDEVKLEGTIRSFDQNMRLDMQERLKRMVTRVAESFGTTADVAIRPVNPVTFNNPDLVRKMRPTLEAVAGKGNLFESELILGTEDFANFAMKVPGMYAFMGVTGPSRDPAEAPANHSAYFQVDRETFVPGITMMVRLATDYLAQGK